MSLQYADAPVRGLASPQVRRVGVSDLLLFVFVVVVLGPFVAELTAQPASRAALTAAVVEHGTVDITGYPHGVDYSIYRGHLRSDKAPGQPLLVAPAYAVWRALHGQSVARASAHRDAAAWWLTLWSSVIPAGLLCVLMRRLVRATAPRAPATVVTLAWFGGSLLLGFATQLYGHVLAAVLALGAYMLIRERLTTRRALASGALCGLAVVVEYPCAIVALVLLVVVTHTGGRAKAAAFIGGAVPFAAALAAYHTVAFGAPWHLPYSYFAPDLARSGAPEGGLSNLRPHVILDTLVGNHGAFTVTPALALALVVAWTARRSSRDVRIALAIGGLFLVLAGAWSGSAATEVAGPRYVIPALGFLVVPFALAWERWPKLATVAAALGAVTMMLSVMTSHLVGVQEMPLAGYLAHAIHHRFTPTIWSAAVGGPAGVAVHLATIAAVAVVGFARSGRVDQRREPGADVVRA